MCKSFSLQVLPVETGDSGAGPDSMAGLLHLASGHFPAHLLHLPAGVQLCSHLQQHVGACTPHLLLFRLRRPQSLQPRCVYPHLTEGLHQHAWSLRWCFSGQRWLLALSLALVLQVQPSAIRRIFSQTSGWMVCSISGTSSWLCSTQSSAPACPATPGRKILLLIYSFVLRFPLSLARGCCSTPPHFLIVMWINLILSLPTWRLGFPFWHYDRGTVKR